jgi:hypothetical protein
MRLRVWLIAAALAAPAWVVWTAPSACGEGEKDGAVVALGELRSRAPAGWKQEEPSNKMRLAQFRLPKKDDDAYDGEVVIFKGAGGSVKNNLDRWKGMFRPPEGKAIDDVAKVDEIRIGGHPATCLDIHGTYLYKARPFDPSAKPQPRPDYRMVAIQFDAPDNVYHIRLTGPAHTVEAYKKGFDTWLKGFRKD